MHTETPETVVATTVPTDANTFLAFIELSKSKWLVTANSPGVEKYSRLFGEGGDSQALLGLIATLREKGGSRCCGQPVDVLVIQEAGFDGF